MPTRRRRCCRPFAAPVLLQQELSDLRDVLHAVRSRAGGCWSVGLYVGLALAARAELARDPSTRRPRSCSCRWPVDRHVGRLSGQPVLAAASRLLRPACSRARTWPGRVVDDLGLDLTPAQVADEVTATAAARHGHPQGHGHRYLLRAAPDIAASLGRQSRRYAGLEARTADRLTVKVTTFSRPGSRLAPGQPRRQPEPRLSAPCSVCSSASGLHCCAAAWTTRSKSADDVQAADRSGLIGTVLEDPRLDEKHVVTRSTSTRSPPSRSGRFVPTSSSSTSTTRPRSSWWRAPCPVRASRPWR